MLARALAAYAALVLPLVLPTGAELQSDEQTLRFANVGTDGPALLEFLRSQIEGASRPDKIQDMIKKLGDDDFAVREGATENLVALGRVALPLLRQAKQEQQDKDAEIVHRAKRCIERIEQGSASLIPAVSRVLAAKRPKG